nr:hypothetical protein [Phenylobacterium sp.]
MADGDLTLKLDDETARRLKDAAEAAGQSVDDFLQVLIREGLAEASQDDDWAEDIRILEDYDRTGVSYSVDEGLAVFDAAMKVHLARRPQRCASGYRLQRNAILRACPNSWPPGPPSSPREPARRWFRRWIRWVSCHAEVGHSTAEGCVKSSCHLDVTAMFSVTGRQRMKSLSPASSTPANGAERRVSAAGPGGRRLGSTSRC